MTLDEGLFGIPSSVIATYQACHNKAGGLANPSCRGSPHLQAAHLRPVTLRHLLPVGVTAPSPVLCGDHALVPDRHRLAVVR